MPSSSPADTIARLRAALVRWKKRDVDVTVEIRARTPSGTSMRDADEDCAAAYDLIDGMMRSAPALLDVAEAAAAIDEYHRGHGVADLPPYRGLRAALARLADTKEDTDAD